MLMLQQRRQQLQPPVATMLKLHRRTASAPVLVQILPLALQLLLPLLLELVLVQMLTPQAGNNSGGIRQHNRNNNTSSSMSCPITGSLQLACLDLGA